MKGSMITTILGYIVIGSTWLEQIFVEQAVPQSGKEWLMFLAMNAGGLIGVFAKDFNRTGGTKPAE